MSAAIETSPECDSQRVTALSDIGLDDLQQLLAGYGMDLLLIEARAEIPGSYWGESEAGLIGNRLYARMDTPVHSILHESCHFICMDQTRRTDLDRDAGGDYDEENAVCFLQIVLADQLAGFSRERMWQDMDLWGYTFRLGSARAWFEQDATDASDWLTQRGILSADQHPTGRRRDQ